MEERLDRTVEEEDDSDREGGRGKVVRYNTQYNTIQYNTQYNTILTERAEGGRW
jgi:hypothetical protein